MNATVKRRASLYCSLNVNRVRLECIVRENAQTRGVFILLMNDVLRKLVEWLNACFVMNYNDQASDMLEEVYCYVAVLFYSHTTGFIFE